MLKKCIFITGLLVAICCSLALVFWEPIIGSLLRNYLSSYCRKCFDAELQIDKVYQDHNTWVFEHPVIATPQSIVEGGKKLEAERLDIAINFHLFQGQIDLDIALVNPKLDVGLFENIVSDEQQLLSENTIGIPTIPIPWMSTQGKIHIEQGLFQLHDIASTSPLQQVAFQCRGNWGLAVNGALTAWVPNSDPLKNRLDIHLSDSNSGQNLNIDLQHIDCTALSKILRVIFPSQYAWIAKSGVVNGHLILTNQKNVHPSLVGKVDLTDLKLENTLFNVQALIPAAHLHLEPHSTNLETNVALFSNLSGSCELTKDAAIIFMDKDILESQETPHKLESLSHISGKTSFSPNQPFSLELTGTCCKKDLSFPFHLSSNGLSEPGFPALKIEFEASGNDAAVFFPENIRNNIARKFSFDNIQVLANINKISSGIQVDGEAKLISAVEKPHAISFGFDVIHLGRGPDWIELPHWQQNENDTETTILLFPALHFNEKVTTSEIAIENGWFSGLKLPLEKYLSALVFNDDQLHFQGTGDFKGVFTHKTFIFEYLIQSISLDHGYFTFETEDLTGKHFIDLSTGHFKGCIPLHNAVYLDKISGLKFSGINTTLTLERNHIHAPHVEAFCNDIYFAGSIDINHEKLAKGSIEIDVHAHTMEGKISQAKQIFSTAFQFPIDGRIMFRERGGLFHISLGPNGIHTRSQIQGCLTEGSLNCENADLTLRDLGLNFDYGYNGPSLELSDIQGTLLIGSPQRSEEYTLSGDYIRFLDFPQGQTEFDLWVGDKSRDILRIAGKTKPALTGSKPDSKYVEFLLDQDLTHFGDVHPKVFQLVLRDWSHIENFQLEFQFQLNTLLHDLQSFNKTGLFFLSRSLLKELDHLNTAEGIFNAKIGFQPNTSTFTYDVNGQDIVLNTHQVKKLTLSGKKRDHTWIIDQLVLDPFSFAADITVSEGKCLINFLGMRCGKSLLAGLEGEFFPKNNSINAKVNLLEIDLSQIDEWPFLKEVVQKYHTKGNVRATGTAHAEWRKEIPHAVFDAQLTMALHHGEIQGISLKDADNIACRWTSTRGITLENIQTSLLEPNTKFEKTLINIKQAHYDFINHEITLDGLDFKIPFLNIPWITTHLNKCLPDCIPSLITELINDSKSSGNLEGSLQITRTNKQRNFRLTLANGFYDFNHQPYELKNFTVEYDPLEYSISTEYIHNLKTLALELHSKEVNSAEICVNDHSQTQLALKWNRDPISGISSQHLKGTLNGAPINLSLAEELKYQPHSLQIENLTIQDPAGKLFAKNIDINQNSEKKWIMSIPLMTIQDLQLSLFFSSDNFIIRQLDLHDFQGNITDPETFTGYGRAVLSSRNVPHLLSIPSETISKMGLDFSHLCPSSGTIDYQIDHQKIHLLKFKDMFSTGKLSKFYLSKDSHSYIDFNGDLHVQVRMKPNNLLHKLADQFTITIQGPLKNPSYNLFKD